MIGHQHFKRAAFYLAFKQPAGVDRNANAFKRRAPQRVGTVSFEITRNAD